MMGYESPLASLPSFLPCNSFFFFFFFFLFTSLLNISAPAYASKVSAPLCLSNQSAALLQFKQGIALQPSRLSSWKKGTNCCHWEGVTCDKTGFPTALQISNVSFNDDFKPRSKLDPSLFELSHLRVLDLGNNGFDGEIPKRLVELTHLTHLDLSKCFFKGAIPMEISQLSRLVYLNLSVLNLSYNDLHGSIPQGKQFSTFDESSFEGNPGLCGSQVHRSCSGGRDNDGVHQQAYANRRGNEDQRKKWEWIGPLGIGFAVGLFMITLPTLFDPRI